jgi:hypothetical protein
MTGWPEMLRRTARSPRSSTPKSPWTPSWSELSIGAMRFCGSSSPWPGDRNRPHSWPFLRNRNGRYDPWDASATGGYSEAACDQSKGHTLRWIAAPANCVAREKPWVLLATILASSIAYIDESVVNIALPSRPVRNPSKPIRLSRRRTRPEGSRVSGLRA